MKISPNDQESIVNLLTRIYLDIVEIEQEYQLVIGDGDFRPRIDYFHDAIRTFTAQDDKSDDERLSVQLLAYDLACLRYLQDMPLSSFKSQAGVQSPATDIMTAGPGLSVPPKRPDRKVRARICELYQHYAVLFAALLKPVADNDYHERIEELNEDIKDLNALANQLEAVGENKGSMDSLMAAAQHLEEEQLRQLLLMFLQHGKHKNKDEIKKLVAFIKQQSKGKDKQIAAIETAHMNFGLNQLGIFENSKDLLKKMAQQGMNLVGKFVEASIAQARHEIGR
jgi:hypothetical protein